MAIGTFLTHRIHRKKGRNDTRPAGQPNTIHRHAWKVHSQVEFSNRLEFPPPRPCVRPMDSPRRLEGFAEIRRLIGEQDVERVHHFHTPADLVRLGRNCERVAIARGIRFHVHDRTIIDGARAIMFPD